MPWRRPGSVVSGPMTPCNWLLPSKFASSAMRADLARWCWFLLIVTSTRLLRPKGCQSNTRATIPTKNPYGRPAPISNIRAIMLAADGGRSPATVTPGPRITAGRRSCRLAQRFADGSVLVFALPPPKEFMDVWKASLESLESPEDGCLESLWKACRRWMSGKPKMDVWKA